MYRLLIRALAVVAVALSPVWGYSSVQAGRALTPYWPSFDSVGCNAVGQSFGGVVISCGTGGYVTTQITSAYGGCSQIDIQVNGFGSGPFYTTATAPVAGLQSTVNINDSGDYYMQLSWVPSTIVGPIQIQFSAPDTGNMSVQNITVNPCPVPPTATPVPPTNTPNPSDTATSTATAGPSHTPTPIPTNTPLPSGHNTFTPTATNTPLPTGTATPTPGPSYRDCGDATYPLLNCDWVGGTFGSGGTPAVNWANYGGGGFVVGCWQAGSGHMGFNLFTNFGGNPYGVCQQTVTPTLSGTLFLTYQDSTGPDGGLFGATLGPYNSFTGAVAFDRTSCPVGGSGLCIANLGSVSSGVSTTFLIQQYNGCNCQHDENVYLDKAWVQPAGTATPATPIPSATGTTTPTRTPTAGPSSTPTLTPVPIPGQQETPIPTDTECPGGCAVKALTAIPGQVGTITTVDTSPFSPLKNLSLSRSSCQPFGYAQIPVPVIHGTPALGSTTPLSFTWTVPVTGAWTNYNSDGTLNISNTAIQPCAMSEIPTFVWDLTYWLSVLMCAIAWFLWLIGFVGRLSGEETING